MASHVAQPKAFTFQHAELGEMTGLITPDNVVQFRAIPYATIPARFKQSIPLNDLGHTNRRFTEHGFACPQTFPDRAADGGRFVNEGSPPPSDEFHCLVLHVNVPLVALQHPPRARLPVLLYIHGGGFVLGAIDEQHNTALLVEQSLLDARPVVGVAIQYRLGALGYLHVPERGGANLALNDQRNALVWVQRFVGGFGGDREAVTVFGESAGAVSICAHLLSEPPELGPLFRRAVVMSGVIGPVTAPVGVGEAEGQYEALLEILGIHEEGEAGLERLRGVDVEQLVAATSALTEDGSMLLSVRDRAWFGEDAETVTWDRIPELIGKCEWVDAIVLGTTSFEGTMTATRYASITPSAFLSSIEAQLGAPAASTISRAYGITASMDQNLFLTSMLRWVGDALFDAPTHMLARHLSTQTSKRIYRYLFDVRNPFPNNALYQQPHHWVDVYFVFKAHQFRFPSQRLKDISTRHAQLWIAFANGEQPWAEYKYTGCGEERVMVADEREGWVERSVERVERDLEWGWGRCEMLVQGWEEAGMKGKGINPLHLEVLKGTKAV
ncbi:uncharacterized protein EKO05_0000739 [Ascochyta rabiei]|uniref:Carboxylic ester hydrolase n=1 Tax=Didymella rabiei TaxID=5454 RepID=A0A163B4M8_DIDRA|nr:uncharacterized protein EKO05_0000739 [Ascochyta rabiei]KZM21571.1 hydrolase [Ascochyta rabiei]UPX10067.1 hypothetical protein EKO05_0000739 [Ascochyta rabiei]